MPWYGKYKKGTRYFIKCDECGESVPANSTRVVGPGLELCAECRAKHKGKYPGATRRKKHEAAIIEPTPAEREAAHAAHEAQLAKEAKQEEEHTQRLRERYRNQGRYRR